MSGKELVLEEVVDNILIGADASCRFHLALPGISPIHARIWMDASGVTVYDTHSPRGLYVNDDRVNGQAPLRNGDILWLGTPGEDEAVMIQVRLAPRQAKEPEPEPIAAAPVPEPAAGEPSADELTAETVMLKAPPAATAPPEEPEVLEVVADDEAEEVTSEADATIVPGPDDLAVEAESPADATLVMGPADEPVLEEAGEADATMVVEAAEEIAPAAEPESDATIVQMPAVVAAAGPPPAPAEPPVDEFYVASSEPAAAEPPSFAETQAVAQADEEPIRFAVDLPPIPEAPPPEPTVFEDELQDSPLEATYVSPVPPPTMAEAPPAPVPVVAPQPPAQPPLAPRASAIPAVTPRPAAEPRAARPSPRPPAPALAPPVAPREPAAASATGRYAMLGAVGLLILAGVSFAGFKLLQKPAAPAATPAPPETVASAPVAPPETVGSAPPQTAPAVVEPPIEEAVTIVKSPPPSTQPAATAPASTRPSPSAAPKTALVATPPPVSPEAARAQQTATQVASLLGQADAAASARNYDSAAGFFDEVLKLDPQNAKATEGKAAAQAVLASLRKAFVAGKTSVQSGSKSTSKAMAGFDNEDVSVAKAPDYSGRVEFETTPKNVKPGDSYTVLVYLTNDGKKSFKLSSVNATTAVNGAKSGAPVQAKAKSTDPQQRVLLAELPGVWQAGTSAWSLEVVVTSDHNDTFKNTLAWK